MISTATCLRRPVLVLLLSALLAMAAACRATPPATPTAPAPTASAAAVLVTPSITPEPIVPTRTSAPQPTATPPAAATVAPTATPAPLPDITSPDFARVGMAGALEDVAAAAAAGLPVANFVNWNLILNPPAEPEGVVYWQMVRLRPTGVVAPWDIIEQVARANPGAFWLVGNEPDVAWQDDLTAEQYAELYHEVYTGLKTIDPTARVGAGGIALASPLRLAYLDRVLTAYQATHGQPMPVDLWSLHAFVLREEKDSWGIGIPPGEAATSGLLYEIDDHGDLALMAGHVRDFRAWMAANGYRDTPLAVTEFGILLPADYGFPPEFVADYLRGSFEFFMSATGDDGYPADGGRLVQWWFWYSLHDPGAYPTGDLYDIDTGELTTVGRAYVEYLLTLPD